MSATLTTDRLVCVPVLSDRRFSLEYDVAEGCGANAGTAKTNANVDSLGGIRSAIQVLSVP